VIGEIYYRLAIKLNNGKYFHGGIDTTKESQFTKALNKELICFDNLDEVKEVIEKDPRLPKDIECKPVKIKITTLYEEINDDTVKKVNGSDDVLNLYTAEELHEDSMPGELDAMTPEKENIALNETIKVLYDIIRKTSRQRNEAKRLLKALLPYAKRPLDAPVAELEIKQKAIADAEKFLSEKD
jgi:hypothetical protein